jgi:RNA polymerase sigma factor (sigma-70 family)
MGHEPEGQSYDRLPDDELCARYHARDPAAFAELWSRSIGELTRVAEEAADGDEVCARAALEATRERLAHPESQAAYDSGRPWMEWAIEVLKEVVADLTHQGLPEDEFQLRYHQGVAGAFWTLWLRHRTELVERAWRFSYRDEEIRDEILYETMARLMQPEACRSYQQTRPWLPWATMAMRKLAIDLHRKRSRRKIPPIDFDPDLLVDPPHLDLEALRRDLDDCLQNLPEDERKLIRLYFFDGKKWYQAARMLGDHNPVWANRTSQRALKQLRDCLTKKGYS